MNASDAAPPCREDFPWLSRIEVRWAEVDAQKIVFNAHYLLYADIAVTHHWRRMAVPWETGFAALGGDLFVKKACSTFHAPARLGDVLDVGLRCTRFGNSSLHFVAGIFRGPQLLNTVGLVYVWADAQTRRPLPVPQPLRNLIEAVQSGRDVVRLQTGAWQELRATAEPLRRAVFVQEQGVPAELELDVLDAQALHAVLFNALGQPIATGRLLPGGPSQEGHIGRMAVAHSLRGGGWGRKVLDALVDAARQRGDRSVALHAQCHAQQFYGRAGFVAEGDVFSEAGIPHIFMRKELRMP